MVELSTNMLSQKIYKLLETDVVVSFCHNDSNVS